MSVVNLYADILCFEYTVCLTTVWKNMKNTKMVYSKYLLRLVVLCVLCCSKFLFRTGHVCLGALKLDLSTLLVTCLL